MPKYFTEADDPIIGRKFGKDDCMEIVGWWKDEPFDSCNLRNYEVHCKKCVEDPELFGPALFKSRRSSMVKGQIPCGCSIAPKWKTEQYHVILKRLGIEGGYISEIPKGLIEAKTKINSTCLVCRHEWITNVNCLQSGSGCSKCVIKRNSLKRRLADDVMCKSFMSTGKFIDGTKFKRVENGKKHHWEVYCPVCSNDEYVEGGVCSGKFRALASNLSTGKKPCRCSNTFTWTKEQREFKIKKIIVEDKLSYSFIDWSEKGYHGAFSKFNIKCEDHGTWEAGVDKFVNMGQRCPTCSSNGGYSPQKTGYLYVLRVSGMTSDFTGFGISNKPARRLANHNKSLSEYGYRVVNYEVFEMHGNLAFPIEQAIKKKFPRYPQEMMGFKTEATYPYLYQDVINFVKEQLDNSHNSADNEEQIDANKTVIHV